MFADGVLVRFTIHQSQDAPVLAPRSEEEATDGCGCSFRCQRPFGKRNRTSAAAVEGSRSHNWPLNLLARYCKGVSLS